MTSWFMPSFGLVQPKPAHLVGLQGQLGQVALNVGGGNRHHFFEYLAPFLAEGFIAGLRSAA